MIKQSSAILAMLIAFSCPAQTHYWRPQTQSEAEDEDLCLKHGFNSSYGNFKRIGQSTWAENKLTKLIIFCYLLRGDSIHIHSGETGNYCYVAERTGYAKMYLLDPEILAPPVYQAGVDCGCVPIPEDSSSMLIYKWVDSPRRILRSNGPILFCQGYTELPYRDVRPEHAKTHWHMGLKIGRDVTAFLIILSLWIVNNRR